MMKKIQVLLPALLFASVLSLSGCASDADKNEEMAPAPEEAMGVEESIESPVSNILEGRTDGPMVPLYFDFDSSKVRENQVTRMDANGGFINGELNSETIRVEGNCDPRGTNEYNNALGERRAMSAKKYLVNLGVAEDRLETVSFGEERLLLMEENEQAWEKNRRADFVIVK